MKDTPNLFIKGEDIQKILESDHSKEFLDNSFNFITHAYYKNFIPFLEDRGEEIIGARFSSEILNLDFSLVKVAIQSAFIDLQRAAAIHEFSNGAPSLNRKAAAITSWLNRFKTVQIFSDDSDELFILVNPIFSLFIGLAVSWSDDLYKTHPTFEDDNDIDVFENVLDGMLDGLINSTQDTYKLLVYHLTWHSPDYRVLTLMFDILSNKK
ncbi:MAG: hypothetical protein HQL91_11495 [Magnetococcales bacterium]|nr:hypothetical protein [Magnetococcales bacterium]